AAGSASPPPTPRPRTPPWPATSRRPAGSWRPAPRPPPPRPTAAPSPGCRPTSRRCAGSCSRPSACPASSRPAATGSTPWPETPWFPGCWPPPRLLACGQDHRPHPGREHMAVDEARLNEFLHRFVGNLGATVHAANVVIGDKLGLYKALAAAGPSTPAELAERSDSHPRYVAEWLAGQAAGGYVAYDPGSGRYRLTEEQAFTLADEQSPAFLPGAF